MENILQLFHNIVTPLSLPKFQPKKIWKPLRWIIPSGLPKKGVLFLVFYFKYVLGPYSLPCQWIQQCTKMNDFFKKKGLPVVQIPTLQNYPANLTFPDGTDKGYSSEESRAMR